MVGLKGKLIVGIAALMICTLFADVANAKQISNPVLGRDATPCDHTNMHFEKCKQPSPANPYNRGCEPSEHCHGGSQRLFNNKA